MLEVCGAYWSLWSPGDCSEFDALCSPWFGRGRKTLSRVALSARSSKTPRHLMDWVTPHSLKATGYMVAATVAYDTTFHWDLGCIILDCMDDGVRSRIGLSVPSHRFVTKESIGL